MRLSPRLLWQLAGWWLIISAVAAQDDAAASWEATHQSFNTIMQGAASIAWEVDWADLGQPPDASNGTSSGDLVSCLNAEYKPKRMTWDVAMHSDLASLRVLAAWSDDRQSDIPVTIVTTSSMDRLPQLVAQCRSWAGPSSMAVFVPVVQTEPWPLTVQNQAMLRDYLLQVGQVVVAMRAHTSGCLPSVLLTYEIFVEDTAAMLFPVNMLRNYARLQARTSLVAMLDADLLPSKSLSERLQQPEQAAQFVESVLKDRAVYIMPALELLRPYETTVWADALATAPNKSLVVWGMQNSMVGPFHMARWPRGHRLTNFQQWMGAEEDYTVQYERHCEPWFIGPRVDLPWHDERYRGFGVNKIQHVHATHAADFEFRVLHDVYVVHRPHKHAAAETVYKKRGRAANSKVSLRAYTEQLFANQYSMIKRKANWHPFLSDATKRCQGRLPWYAASGLQAPTGSPRPPIPPLFSIT